MHSPQLRSCIQNRTPKFTSIMKQQTLRSINSTRFLSRPLHPRTNHKTPQTQRTSHSTNKYAPSLLSWPILALPFPLIDYSIFHIPHTPLRRRRQQKRRTCRLTSCIPSVTSHNSRNGRNACGSAPHSARGGVAGHNEGRTAGLAGGVGDRAGGCMVDEEEEGEKEEE